MSGQERREKENPMKTPIPKERDPIKPFEDPDLRPSKQNPLNPKEDVPPKRLGKNLL